MMAATCRRGRELASRSPRSMAPSGPHLTTATRRPASTALAALSVRRLRDQADIASAPRVRRGSPDREQAGQLALEPAFGCTDTAS